MEDKQNTATSSVTSKPSFVLSPAQKSHYAGRAFAGLAILALSFGGGWLGAASHDRSGGSTSIVQQRTVLTDKANLVSNIAKTVGESVVSVNVTARSQSGSSMYGGFFGYGYGPQTQESAGTGIILTTDGLIMTNRHVVPSGTTDVSVTLSDGTVLDKVKVVGRTSANDSLDIAFLQVQDLKGRTLKAAKLGDSSKMQVGDAVVAIGNALGQFQNTVTSGIISGYGRSVQAGDGNGSSVENLDNLFQTDAAINEGNSGGPLVNINDEVIGVNTAIASGSQNVGFAIPINDVKGLIDSVKSSGKLERPYLGVRYVILTDDIAKQYELSVSRGAYIPKASDMGSETVLADGPAAKAGLEEGDVITKVDGVAVDEKTSLVSLLGKHKPGDSVTLTVVRGEDTKTIDVKLEANPGS
ncbi:trypsin-like peptidase domain-containing protein [Candidatus Saccharibacteria bacterium]|nr:trypsin-like peptidase domain-containing protein [Candidatus Saccharibacteria bacterium]